MHFSVTWWTDGGWAKNALSLGTAQREGLNAGIFIYFDVM